MAENVPLTESVVPETKGLQEDHPGIATGFPGNLHDDDSLAVDEYFEAADQGPEEYGGIPVPVAELPRPTRLLIRSFRVPTFNQVSGTEVTRAIQVLGNDTDRKQLVMVISNPTASGVWFLWSPENFSTFASTGVSGTAPGPLLDPALSTCGAVLVPSGGNTSVTLDQHNGPLFAGAWDNAAGTGSLSVSIQVVTL